jgi:DNA-directed RNA polymerase specialized sigma24 family protein
MRVAGADRFETTAMPHLDALFQTAVQLTPNREEVEDMLQEVYECAFQSFVEGKLWSDARVQLFKVLMHRLRSRRRSTPDSNGVRDTLGSALLQMPRDLREVVLLVDGQELSYSETAEILGLSAEAVADRVVMAREHLLGATGGWKTGSPPFEGGVAAPSKKMSDSFEGADGVVVQATDYRLKQPPRLRPLRKLRGILLMAQPPFLRKEGNALLLTHCVQHGLGGKWSAFPRRAVLWLLRRRAV